MRPIDLWTAPVLCAFWLLLSWRSLPHWAPRVAQAPSPQATAAQPPRRRLRPRRKAPSEGVLTPATVCGLEVPAPINAPPAGTPTVVYALVLCFEKQGGTSVIEPQTYQYYMELQNQRQHPVSEQVGAVHRGDRAGHPRRLQAPLGDQLPRRPVDRRPRRGARQRRHRQAGHLQHGGAPADQDRRLRRIRARSTRGRSTRS